MNRLLLSLLLAVLSPAALHSGTPGVDAAHRLAQRLLGGRASTVTFEEMGRVRGEDVFEVEASHGLAIIRGSDTPAMVRGLYHYLRNACNAMVSWSGSRLSLPTPLPDFPRTRVTSPYTFRQHFNVCTFGYTTVWWDWARWQKEIDWMALHGINMPLAMVGQEAVWQKVWREMGISQKELDEYFTGPAFLPWHRMGNVNGHGGPLPQSWIDGQADLQKKILTRMRELGMHPVVPAFSGFVPPALGRLHPEAEIHHLAAWADFPERQRTHLLSPTSPLFHEIGTRFIAAYRAMFGQARYYLADSFNELQVPVTEDHRYDELAAYGKAVYSSIADADTQGVWVMQGWLFFNDRLFWDNASVRALLREVPDDRMIILDLANEMFHGWKVQDAFYGKQWIYSTIHNFGGNNPLHGDLEFTGTDPITALRSPGRGHQVGIGLAPEGTDNNDVVYELATDMYWSDSAVDLKKWLQTYAASRYGVVPAAMREAGSRLVASAYSASAANIRHAFQLRPGKDAAGNVNTGEEFREGVRLFLSCADQLRHEPLYVADAVDLVGQVAGGAIDERLRLAQQAHASSMPGLRDSLAGDAFALMGSLDSLLGSRTDRQLQSWISAARRWGKTDEERKLMEYNARMQVTLWGGPELYDYASKVWSGLVGSFYRGRWERYMHILSSLPPEGIVPADSMVAWEERWVASAEVSPPAKVSDPLNFARRLFARALRPPDLVRQPTFSPETGVFETGRPPAVTISTTPPGAVIRYTIDGSVPDEHSKRYTAPIVLRGDVELSARAYIPGRPPSFIASKRYSAVTRGVNGLSVIRYIGAWSLLPRFQDFPAVDSAITYVVSAHACNASGDGYGLWFRGRIVVEREGLYVFTLRSDDGSRLVVDGNVVVDNDGLHGATDRTGRLELTAGRHNLEVLFFENAGAEQLDLTYEGPGIARQPIPPSHLLLPARQ
jgi:alpha-N-acetylglucosaminidase